MDPLPNRSSLYRSLSRAAAPGENGPLAVYPPGSRERTSPRLKLLPFLMTPSLQQAAFPHLQSLLLLSYLVLPCSLLIKLLKLKDFEFYGLSTP